MPVRARQWALLAILLAFGVAVMHTLGPPAANEPSPRHSMGVMTPTHATHPVDPHSDEHPATADLFASSLPVGFWSGPAHQSVVRDPSPPRYGMAPGLMCLAVLTAALVLLVAAVGGLLPGRAADHDRPVSPLALRRLRGPPAGPVGTILAALSVMRI